MNPQTDDSARVDLSGYFNDLKKDNPTHAPSSADSLGVPRMTKWMIEYSGGIIRNKKEAAYASAALAAILITAALAIFFQRTSSKFPPGIDTYKNAPPSAIPHR